MPNDQDPAAVVAVDQQMNADLADARGGAAQDALKDFLKDTYVTGPATSAVGQAVDGNGSGND